MHSVARVASKEIGRAEIPIVVEVVNVGYLAQLVHLPCLSTRARGTLRSPHKIPLGEEKENREIAQRGGAGCRDLVAGLCARMHM